MKWGNNNRDPGYYRSSSCPRALVRIRLWFLTSENWGGLCKGGNLIPDLAWCWCPSGGCVLLNFNLFSASVCFPFFACTLHCHNIFTPKFSSVQLTFSEQPEYLGPDFNTVGHDIICWYMYFSLLPFQQTVNSVPYWVNVLHSFTLSVGKLNTNIPSLKLH